MPKHLFWVEQVKTMIKQVTSYGSSVDEQAHPSAQGAEAQLLVEVGGCP